MKKTKEENQLSGIKKRSEKLFENSTKIGLAHRFNFISAC